MSRTNFDSGAQWEHKVGYSRAVRMGHIIEVAGTTAVNEQGELVGRGDAYAQAMFILEKIEQTLKGLDAGMENVIRTRMYVTDISLWEAVGKAHGHFFSNIRPATTMIEVSRLINPDMLVEIEATAVL
jgi:enamine deaminase RidA (YjgF/YER057c/UK114 family)